MDRNTILYAEDDAGLRGDVEGELRTEFPDYVVESYNDGIPLSQRIEKDPRNIAVVVTDNTMINLHGLEVVKKFTKNPEYAGINFIMYYGGDESLGELAKELGAFGYALKGERGSLDRLLNLTREALLVKK